jgi:RNA polymerase-binding protein DksA
MNKKVLKSIEKKLLAKREEIINTIDKEKLDEIADVESENVIGDIVDTANSAYEVLIKDELSEKEQQKLREINEALQRIDEQVYGKCVVCGNSIDEKRLIAIPEAKKCLVCKMAEEKKRR